MNEAVSVRESVSSDWIMKRAAITHFKLTVWFGNLLPESDGGGTGALFLGRRINVAGLSNLPPLPLPPHPHPHPDVGTGTLFLGLRINLAGLSKIHPYSHSHPAPSPPPPLQGGLGHCFYPTPPHPHPHPHSSVI